MLLILIYSLEIMEIFGRVHVLVEVKSGCVYRDAWDETLFFPVFQFSMKYCNTIWFSTFHLYLKYARKIVIISNNDNKQGWEYCV